MDARDIATGGDNAALATAYNDRLVAQRGIIALFNRRIKSIAINMRDFEVVQFVMIKHARRAATCAASRAALKRRQTISTKGEGLAHAPQSG